MAEPKQNIQPPPDDVQAEVAQAAAETAAAGGSQAQVAEAAQQAAEQRGYELTDEQAKLLAGRLAPLVTAGVIAEFEKRGAFVEAPEPVQAHPAPPAPVEERTAAAPEAAPPAPADQDVQPRRQTWADRHFG